MRIYSPEVTLFDIASKLQAAFTVTAATDLITSNAHGLNNFDIVHVASATTLPAGLSASTDYYVRNVTTNTFQLSATYDGDLVDITDTGTGTHTFYLKSKVFDITDYKSVELFVTSSGSADLTYKVQYSNQEDVDFKQASSSTNRWQYVALKDIDSGSTILGSTGRPLTGTDETRIYEVNINSGVKIAIEVSSWVAGNLQVKARGFDNQ